MKLHRTLVPLLLLAACGPAAEVAPPPPHPVSSTTPPPVASGALPHADDPIPLLRLPSDVRPLDEAIELHVDPKQERFSGIVDITVQLDAPRGVIWLHGKDMKVARATVTPEGAAAIPATWEQKHETGVASLTLASAAPAGKAKLHIEFDAPLANGQKGLYKTKEAGVDYVFTQFEAIGARQAFPCFDEPAFKIPFTATLVVPPDAQAVANTHETARALDAGSLRVSFAPTLPLPSYLVAFAVGPLDIVPVADVPPNGVRTRALPLRGVAAKGRGKEMAYALAHTGEILATLEKYFGIEYPYDKLDILAVPGKRGAMENAGAVTFGESLVLLDPATAPVNQRRAYAGVMAHELAHQWTGDLVTMPWWDDTWLNEAFATWVGNKTADQWDPKTRGEMTLLRGVQGAMGADSLVSARAIRQPITSTHDIENAFDSITYQKGGGVLSMFEKWAGVDVWQKGLHGYLEKHRFGSGSADDFLAAESEATGKDVKTAFHTFLDQSGVPLVEVSLECGKTSALHMTQSRFLPIGSTGSPDRTWQIPICARFASGKGAKEACTLMTEKTATLDLGAESCPAWVFPNSDAAGYFRFSLAPKDLANLRRNGFASLTVREKVAYATSIRTGYSRATTSMKDVFDAVAPLASESDPAVAEEPMGYVGSAREWLFSDPLRTKIETYGRELYAPAAKRLGWEAKKDEDDETRTLRASVLGFLANTARDKAVRAEAKRRGLAYVGLAPLVPRPGTFAVLGIVEPGIHPEAVDANLAALALSVVGEDADRATWDAMKALLSKTVDEVVRGRLLWALSNAKNPELAARARELVLDPELHESEIMTPLYAQLGAVETRDVAWAWLKEHYDAVVQRLPRHHSGVALVSSTRPYCDDEHAKDVEAFFTPKIDSIEGGPRTLAGTLEDIRLCAAKRKAQEPSAREFFGKRR